MEPGAAEKGRLRLELRLPSIGHRRRLNVDGRAIQQALINLIDNAIKHSPKSANGRRWDWRMDTSNVHSSLWVEDHGPGIPPEEHERFSSGFTAAVPNCAAKPRALALA